MLQAQHDCLTAGQCISCDDLKQGGLITKMPGCDLLTFVAMLVAVAIAFVAVFILATAFYIAHERSKYSHLPVAPYNRFVKIF